MIEAIKILKRRFEELMNKIKASEREQIRLSGAMNREIEYFNKLTNEAQSLDLAIKKLEVKEE